MAAIPCYQCDARCCSRYVIRLTGYDAWSLVHGQLLDWNEFVVLMLEKDPTPHGFRLDRTGTTYNLVLSKVETPGTTSKPYSQGDCVFLFKLPGGFGRCGVYAHRPLPCRTYPLGMWAGGLHLGRDLPCPTNGWNLALLDLPDWKTTLLQQRMEKAIYAYMVAVWNAFVSCSAQTVDAEIYFMYLDRVYSQLEQVRQHFDSDDWQLVLSYWLDDTAPELEAHPVLGQVLEQLSLAPLEAAPQPTDAWTILVYAVASVALDCLPFMVEKRKN